MKNSAKTNEGIDTPITANNEENVSIHVFFFNAAVIPHINPKTTPTTTACSPIRIDIHKRASSICDTGIFF